jgi:crotonobetainyl-CoA:carnitine CoA-transferase CaiB-like acyl-CoA transferase
VLQHVKPDIIMIAMSGYGATGPESDFVSYGPAQVPLSGMSSLTGYRDWPPMHVGISYGDPTGGLHGAVAVLAALLHRERTGRGQFIDMSQQETTIAVIPDGVMEYTMNGTQPPRDGNRDPRMAPHGIFRCAGEQRWVAIAVRDDAEWQRLAGVMGRPDAGTDPQFATLAARKANEDRVEEMLTAWTSQRSPEEVTALLQAAAVPAFAAYNSKDLSDDAHLTGAGFFVQLQHPEIGARQHVGIPWRMSGTPCAVQRPAPCLGAHTDYVLGDLLGYSRDAITELKAAGVVN